VFTTARHLFLILRQTSPFHTLPSRFLSIYFHSIPPFTSRSSKWSLSVRFPNQNPLCFSPLPYECHMPRPSNSWFDEPNNIWTAVSIIKLRCLHFPVSRHYGPHRPTASRSTLFSYILSLSFSIVRDQVSHPYKTTCAVIFVSFNLHILAAGWKTKGSTPNELNSPWCLQVTFVKAVCS
jgi:hypothetical protein